MTYRIVNRVTRRPVTDGRDVPLDFETHEEAAEYMDIQSPHHGEWWLAHEVVEHIDGMEGPCG